MNEQIFNEPGRSVNLFEALKPHIRPDVGLSELIGIMNKQSLSPDVTFHSVGEVAQWLSQEWYAEIPKKIKGYEQWEKGEEFEIRLDYPRVYAVPGEWIRVGNRRVIVHGVFHPITTGYPHLNAEFPEVLRKYAEFTSLVGDRWFAESSLKEIFNLPVTTYPLHELSVYLADRARAYKPRQVKRASDIEQFVNYQLQELYMGTDGYDKMSTFSEFKDLLKLYQKNYHSLMLLKYDYKLCKLPEPLDMEVMLALDSREKGFGKELRHSVIQRSFLQTQEILSLFRTLPPENNDLCDHVVVGLAHESQDAYMLLHPDYKPLEVVRQTQREFYR
jgi:hypothetical protein